MYSKKIIIFLTILFLYFFFPSTIKAVTISINNYPSSISTEIFNVDVSVQGATDATNYLRIDLYKDTTSNYFGETYNGSDWYSGSDGKLYFPILVQNSTASATIQAQLGNPSESDYSGPGTYKLKIRRYTSSGSQSSNDSQLPVDIQINYVRPTPTITSTPTVEATNTVTPVPTSIPTKTATSIPTPTKTVTPKPTSTITPTPTSEPTIESEFKDNENGLSNSSTSSPEGMVAGVSTTKKTPLLSIILVLLGMLFLGYGAFLLFNRKKSEYNVSNGQGE